MEFQNVLYDSYSSNHIANIMFYCQRESNPVWIVVNSKDSNELNTEPIMKSYEQLCRGIEQLYQRHKPPFENLIYQNFYNFVLQVIQKGVCNSSIQRLFMLISEVGDYRLKRVVGTHMIQVAELLLSDEEDEDTDYMKEMLRRRMGKQVQEDAMQTQRKNLNELDNSLVNQEFEYFERVYQGIYHDEQTQTQKKQLDFSVCSNVTIFPLNISSISQADRNLRYSNLDWKKALNLSGVDCLSQIQGEGESEQINPIGRDSISFRSGRKSVSRCESIVISEKYIAPILMKEIKQQSKITQEFQNLIKEFGFSNQKYRNLQPIKTIITPIKRQEKSEVTQGHERGEVINTPVKGSHTSLATDFGNSSTKESMRTKQSTMLKKINYKVEYDKKIKTATLMTRTNPYQIRRKV